MTQLTIVLNGKTHKLDQADLLQAGGEGMVFALGDDRAVKVYHQTTAAQQQKLAQFVGVSMAGRLPSAVIAPQELIYNPQGEIIGFTMRRMAAEAQPLRSWPTRNTTVSTNWASPNWWPTCKTSTPP